MTNTKFITNTLGPLGINWKFSEKKRVQEPSGRIRVCAEIKVRKSVVFADTEDTGFTSVSVWGTADSHTAATNEAIENALMFLRLHPSRAKAYGLDRVIEQLGPAGENWNFEVLSSNVALTHGGSTTNKVKVSIKKASLTGTDEKGSISHTETCQVAHHATATLHPDEEATIRAIKKCMVWFCISTDESLWEEPIHGNPHEKNNMSEESKGVRFSMKKPGKKTFTFGFSVSTEEAAPESPLYKSNMPTEPKNIRFPMKKVGAICACLLFAAIFI